MIRFLMHPIVFISLLSLFSFSTFAEDNDYKINEIIQLNHSQNVSSDWHQFIATPSNEQQFFVTNKTGQMFLVDDMNAPRTVFDINTTHSREQSSIKLTAIELHPNFSLRDQPGYGSFYTAHLEAIDKNSKTKRLKERGTDLALKFDAVLTEWSFSSAKDKKVDAKSKREVLRIGVPENSMTIRQISFSPYTKSWNDNFGLLYIALNGEEKWQKPLYSGVILRIDPARFGLRSFTVPKSNPYLKDSSIKDEIYLLGGQDIRQFIWPDKNSDDILLSHRNNNTSFLSLISVGDDWRDNASRTVIYQSDSIINDVLTYHGRNLPYLRNRLLLLKQEAQHWLIESLDMKPAIHQSTHEEDKPQQELKFNEQQLANDSEVTLNTASDGEVLLVDKTAGIVYQISQENIDIAMSVAGKGAPSATQEGSAKRFYALFVALIIIAIVFYFFKRSRFSAKAVVRRQFAHVELSESQQQIGFYHRHQKSIDTVLDMMDIVGFEVKLNSHTVNVINQNIGHGFNDEKEQDLRAIFAKEQVDKMIDGKVRQVNLQFTDKHKKNYSACLYMRKGSDRITKKTYSVVIDDVIDWCWVIAEKINPNETGERTQKPTISVVEAEIVEKNQNHTLWHNQDATIPTATDEVVETPSTVEKYPVIEQSSVAETSEDVAVDKHSKPEVNSTINTELVNALEKLVDLKQQGFLTQDEFIKAKENLMQSLFDK